MFIYLEEGEKPMHNLVADIPSDSLGYCSQYS